MLHGLVDSLLWLKDFFELLPSSEAITRVFKVRLLLSLKKKRAGELAVDALACQFSGARFQERFDKGAAANLKDVFHHLLAEGDDAGTRLNHLQLSKESQLIVGGMACPVHLENHDC